MTETPARAIGFFRLLPMVLGIAAALGAGLVSVFLSPAAVFGVLAIVLGTVAVTVRWPYGALFAMVAASALSHFSVAVGGWNARPEHYVAGLILAACGIRCVAGKQQEISLNRTDHYLIVYLAWSWVSSAAMSPDRGLTLRWALLNSLAVLPYFLVKRLGSEPGVLPWLFRLLLGAGIAECAYSLLCFAAHHALGTPFGIGDDQYAVSVGGVYGTFYEPNLLGAYAGCLATMLLVLCLASENSSGWVFAGFFISFLALVVSLSRAALLGLAALLLVLFSIALGRRGFPAFRLLRQAAVVALASVLVAPLAVRNLSERFQTLSIERPEEDPDTAGRMVSYAVALQDIARHPVAGNGAASFQLLAAEYESVLGARPWVGNVLVRTLHDTGLAGLAALGFFLCALAWRVKRALERRGPVRERILALAAGGILYAISFQATDGTLLAFFWVHLGILAAAVAVAEREFSAATPAMNPAGLPADGLSR